VFRLGRDCLCRRDAPRLAGLSSPLCWRCSGAALGALFFLPASAYAGPGLHACAVWGCLLALPATADVLLQILTRYRSGPARRFATGLLLGCAVVLLCRAAVALAGPYLLLLKG